MNSVEGEGESLSGQIITEALNRLFIPITGFRGWYLAFKVNSPSIEHRLGYRTFWLVGFGVGKDAGCFCLLAAGELIPIGCSLYTGLIDQCVGVLNHWDAFKATSG